MNDDERVGLSLRIARERARLGLSKEAAAEKAGVTTTTWRRAESGLRVQSHKLAAILAAVGIDDSIPDTPERTPDIFWADQVFVLPPEIETGYSDTVRFTRAVTEHVPTLSQRATRLMLDAAALFAAAGDALLAEVGGDEDGTSTTLDIAAYRPEADEPE